MVSSHEELTYYWVLREMEAASTVDQKQTMKTHLEWINIPFLGWFTGFLWFKQFIFR